MKVTEQLPLGLSAQLVGETLPPLAVKLTVPVGVVGVPADVSVTVAVHVLVPLTAIGLAQLTLVDVARLLTVIEPLPELIA